jgi:D-alanyl-D-alanine carboxypeptidase (penicillin-binding protein 5/6)
MEPGGGGAAARKQKGREMQQMDKYGYLSRRGFLGVSGLAAWRASAAGKPAPKTVEKPVGAICIDVDTGRILFQQEADTPRVPASLVKMMQLLLVAEGLEAGRWTPEQVITVSAKAQGMGGTQVLLAAGETWPLEHLMQAVAVASANDAAMAVAEGLWGSEAEYLRVMNVRAAELGMTNTEYHSVHGLPPDRGKEPDVTTAGDMARLALTCVCHPRILGWTCLKELKFRPEGAIHYNTNKMLWRMPDCDGLKTGYIRAAGFCVVATAKRGNIRLIGVVLGSNSKYGRFNFAEEMLDNGFATMQKVTAGGMAADTLPVLAGVTTPGWRLEVRDGVARWHGLEEKGDG